MENHREAEFLFYSGQGRPHRGGDILAPRETVYDLKWDSSCNPYGHRGEFESLRPEPGAKA
jgi:hypothetical protein